MRAFTWRLQIFVFIVVFAALYYLFSHRDFTQQSSETQTPYTGTHIALNPSAEHGFLPLQEAEAFCRRRRWKPFSTRDRRRKLYDMFLINTELDWAEIRLNELHEQVDYFVVLESAQTFQETPKPPHFQDHLAQFQNFHPKIIHQVVDFSNANIQPGDTWGHEHFTSNALIDQVLVSLVGDQAPNEGDVLIVGDVDEVPRLNTITALRNCAFPPRVTLMSHFYYYSFQWLNRGSYWPHPQATYYAGPSDTIKPEDLRSNDHRPYHRLYNAAWHCSSCFSTMADLVNKIESFSHKAYNHPYILNSTKLLERIRWGEDLFERKEFGKKEEAFDRVDANLDVPGYLLKEENRQRFVYMLDRDPLNGNFQDTGKYILDPH